MLRKSDITYPITFTSFGVGKFTMVDDRSGQMVDRDGNVRDFQQNIAHFINQHNENNPDNDPGSDYHYVMGDKSSGLTPKMGECAIEDMPIGATLTGVQLDDGVWLEMKIVPRRIEVDAEVVTLLLHSHYQPNTKNSRFAGEVSVARGAIVRWEKA